jgi:hypothetical protein
MKLSLALLSLLAGVASARVGGEHQQQERQQHPVVQNDNEVLEQHQMFLDWMANTKKATYKDEEEMKYRLSVWMVNHGERFAAGL